MKKAKFQGRIGWAVGKRGKTPRIKGGTMANNNSVKNLIVDTGLDLAGTASVGSMASRCFVGTGTTPTTANMTALEAEYASGNGGANYTPAGSQDSTDSAVAAPWWHETTYKYTFPADGVDGAALAEIGFFNTTSGSKIMFSRVLFRDALGDPTTITVLPDEQLTIFYTLRVEVPTGDQLGTIDIDGATYNYTLRPANADANNLWNPINFMYGPADPTVRLYENGVLGNEEGAPTGTLFNISDSYSAYAGGSFERKVNCSASTSQANGEINLLYINNMWQMLLDAPFTKTSNDTLNFSEFFTIGWAAA